MSWANFAGDGAMLAVAAEPLNAQGWTIMLISVGSVVSLTFYCIRRVLQLPTEDVEDIKGPLEIDTGDTIDAD